MQQEENTYLEDFLLTLELVPNVFRRDCELIRELDREVCGLGRALGELESSFLGTAQAIKSHRQRLQEMESNAPPVQTVPSSSRKRTRNSVTDTAPQVSPEEAQLRETIAQLEQERDDLWREIRTQKDKAARRMVEKESLAQSLLALVDQYSCKLDNELAAFSAELKGGGEYEPPRGFPVDTEVACYVDLLQSEEKTLFNGRVVAHRVEINSYDIVDVDDGKVHTVPENQVFPLGQADAVKRISKGDVLFALYPESTSFYPATVVSAAKKGNPSEASVVVQFIGDEDQSGTIPLRSVLVKNLVRAPHLL